MQKCLIAIAGVSKLALFSIAAQSLDAPAAAAVPHAPNGQQQLDDATVDTKSLPFGDSAIIRARLMNWHSQPTTSSSLIERIVIQKPSKQLAISSGFGWRTDPLGAGSRRHSGVDLPSRAGSAVYSTGPGRVVRAGWSAGYGNLVEIEHGNRVRTRYGHLKTILVSNGDTVEMGEIIGQVGSTGRSTGPHLHYEVRVGGIPEDPLLFVGQALPRYGVAWAPERIAVPRWDDWSNADAEKLPQAAIR